MIKHAGQLLSSITLTPVRVKDLNYARSLRDWTNGFLKLGLRPRPLGQAPGSVRASQIFPLRPQQLSIGRFPMAKK